MPKIKSPVNSGQSQNGIPGVVTPMIAILIPAISFKMNG